MYEKKVIRKIKAILRHLHYIEESFDAPGRDRDAARDLSAQIRGSFVRWYMPRGFYKRKGGDINEKIPRT